MSLLTPCAPRRSSGRRLFFLLAALAALLPAQTQDRTRNPHGPLPMSCEGCHTATAWQPIRPHPEFNHNTQTAYPLRGMHAGVACQACHTNPVFKKTAHDCAACHADLHRAQMGTNCEQCHTVRGWTPASRVTAREHSNRFPLLGAHATVQCESCHRGAANGVFVGMSTECVTCHRTDFLTAQNPPHQSGNFPLDCSMCHSMSGWLGAKFDHAAIAHFPLTGAHATLVCTACHVGGRFTGTPAACVSCHQADLQSANNPNHLAGGFSTDCAQCHGTATWLNATFDHNALSGFPLTGAHATVTCTQCHTGNSFATAPRACNGCHMSDFTQTTNPNHTQAGFPTDCSLCHSTINWTGATFDHSKTTFPLTGAHVSVPCASCHVANNYTTVPADCYSCHKTDYTGVQNPNHITSGFPTACTQCHNSTTWAGATFNHTWFPIYSGTHNKVWTTCADCHLDPANYNSFSCIACHTHNEAATDPAHRNVRGYSYAPTVCYQCHPQGRR